MLETKKKLFLERNFSNHFLRPFIVDDSDGKFIAEKAIGLTHLLRRRSIIHRIEDLKKGNDYGHKIFIAGSTSEKKCENHCFNFPWHL